MLLGQTKANYSKLKSDYLGVCVFQIFMLQRRKMQPDDFVDTSPLDIFTRLIGFCYTCLSYRVSRWRKIVNCL